MTPEIEAKFLDVGHDALRQKLKALGAIRKHPKRLMRRYNYDFLDHRLEAVHGWVRLRDQGDKVTLTYKQQDARTLHGMQEVEIVVSEFVQADAFLRAIGLAPRAYQETKRESWELDGVQVELDEWPWIPPFAEIEGPNEAAVWAAAKKLGFDPKHAAHGSVEVAYQTLYDVTDEEIYAISELAFGPVPEWLELKRKKTT